MHFIMALVVATIRLKDAAHKSPGRWELIESLGDPSSQLTLTGVQGPASRVRPGCERKHRYVPR